MEAGDPSVKHCKNNRSHGLTKLDTRPHTADSACASTPRTRRRLGLLIALASGVEPWDILFGGQV
jgi:hypothetical protein